MHCVARILGINKSDRIEIISRIAKSRRQEPVRITACMVGKMCDGCWYTHCRRQGQRFPRSLSHEIENDWERLWYAVYTSFQYSLATKNRLATIPTSNIGLILLICIVNFIRNNTHGREICKTFRHVSCENKHFSETAVQTTCIVI